jgi:protein phosphatase
MSEDRKTLKVESSALSDRGLNERRPLNEDAYLHDRERSIFAVADGVGGAEAGEVASQTAPTSKT